ncbi:MAG: T9SS type A sorting domain-containing protein, partial [Bacteroidetes bacterium]|nr:T9SS type A sorting domain-containing protein [Bacteroidota bacterium]
PSTKIKFDIPKSSYVKLIIYDVLGREITTLVDEKLNAGRYDVNWDGSSYPSGVYFYRLVTDEYVNVKRMVLLK